MDTPQPAQPERPAQPEPLAVEETPPRKPDRRIRRIFVGLFILAAFMGAAVGYELLQPKVYGAQAELLLTARPELSDTAADRAMVTQVMIVESPAVLQPVADQAGIPLTRLEEAVTVEVVGRSNILRIIVAARSPARAVTLAGLITDRYFQVTASVREGEPAPIGATVLTPARPLADPLRPRPLRALAAGALLGLLATAVWAVALWRPWRLIRPAPYWT